MVSETLIATKVVPNPYRSLPSRGKDANGALVRSTQGDVKGGNVTAKGKKSAKPAQPGVNQAIVM